MFLLRQIYKKLTLCINLIENFLNLTYNPLLNRTFPSILELSGVS